MTSGLHLKYLYHDNDIIEVQVFVGNGRFCGTANVYVGIGQLSEAASLLQGFPQQSSDRREVIFGAFGRNYAGGGVRLRFYCKDSAGHAVVEATIEADHIGEEPAESAVVLANIEPASLDLFVPQLRLLEANFSGTASLRILDN
jgi:hypothetical protein